MFNEMFEINAKLHKALSNPKRLEIINLLRDKELAVNQIREMLYLPQGNLSQHLMVLRHEGIVKTRKDGKEIYYTISDLNFIKVCDLIRSVLLQRYKGSVLCEYLASDINELVPLVLDPVCGMRLSPKTASFSKSIGKNKYYFCASGCMHKFTQNPKKYVGD